MTIFDCSEYKDFVLKWVRSRPKSGYGEFKKISEHLGVGSVLISQIFKGDRDLSEEQALDLSEYLNLLDIEKRYFLLLVRRARAGSKKLERHIQKEIDDVIERAKKLKERVKDFTELSHDDQSTFYSSWHYSAIRLATDVPELRSIEKISEHLSLEPHIVKSAVEFLLEKGLCVLENGELRLGPSIVFLSADSPFINARQMSWRIKAGAQMGLKRSEDLFFTSPVVCSRKTKSVIRNKVIALVNEILAEVKDSPSEELACLNIDWFNF